MLKLGNVYINAREISIMEAVYRVCGMKLKHSSREVIFIPANQNSARITKPIQILKQSYPTNDNIWMTNIGRYIAKPKSTTFENMTLAHFASNHKIKDRITQRSSNDEPDPRDDHKVYCHQNNMGSIVKKKTPAVIRYTNYNRKDFPANHGTVWAAL